MAGPHVSRVFGAVNLGSFRISAIVAGLTDDGEVLVLGSGHRESKGIRRGFVTDMRQAAYAVLDAVERAEKMADTSVSSVWVGCSGAGLKSSVARVDIEIGGRRIEHDDVLDLLASASQVIEPEGRTILHAHPASYTLDGAHGVAEPVGLYAENLGVDIHTMLADGAPVRNVRETVQNAHLKVASIVASPVATGQAVLTAEERELGVALVEIGAQVTNIAVFHGGMIVGLVSIPFGSGDVTDAIASSFGIRRQQAERLKCVHGSAIASPADHREMIAIDPPQDAVDAAEGGTSNRRTIPRADLVAVITTQFGALLAQVNNGLKSLEYMEKRGRQVVLTGGGAELAGLADFAQGSLGLPVRIGSFAPLAGLAEAHVKPGFATLAGLVHYSVAEPLDIRKVSPAIQPSGEVGGAAIAGRFLRALREYF